MRYVVALGANSGPNRVADARRIARAALNLMRTGGAARLSDPIASTAWPPGSGPDFVNAVMTLCLPVPPGAALRRLHAIEGRMGRVRRERWGARTVDLDLVAAGRLVRPDAAAVRRWIGLPPARQRREAPDRLLLPHPRLQDRGFVLDPMRQVAPRWRHPVLLRRTDAMWRALPVAARRGLRRLAPILPPRRVAGPPRVKPDLAFGRRRA